MQKSKQSIKHLEKKIWKHKNLEKKLNKNIHVKGKTKTDK